MLNVSVTGSWGGGQYFYSSFFLIPQFLRCKVLKTMLACFKTFYLCFYQNAETVLTRYLGITKPTCLFSNYYNIVKPGIACTPFSSDCQQKVLYKDKAGVYYCLWSFLDKINRLSMNYSPLMLKDLLWGLTLQQGSLLHNAQHASNLVWPSKKLYNK